MSKREKVSFRCEEIFDTMWGSGARVRVEVSGPTKFLKLAKKVVVTVFALDGRLQCDWDEEWKGWGDYQQQQQVRSSQVKARSVNEHEREPFPFREWMEKLSEF